MSTGNVSHRKMYLCLLAGVAIAGLIIARGFRDPSDAPGSIVLLCLLPAILAVVYFFERGNKIQKSFASLGVLRGKRYDEIVDAVGEPNSVSSLPENKKVIQWIAFNYHISLIFDEYGVCEGVSHEHHS